MGNAGLRRRGRGPDPYTAPWSAWNVSRGRKVPGAPRPPAPGGTSRRRPIAPPEGDRPGGLLTILLIVYRRVSPAFSGGTMAPRRRFDPLHGRGGEHGNTPGTGLPPGDARRGAGPPGAPASSLEAARPGRLAARRLHRRPDPDRRRLRPRLRLARSGRDGRALGADRRHRPVEKVPRRLGGRAPRAGAGPHRDPRARPRRGRPSRDRRRRRLGPLGVRVREAAARAAGARRPYAEERRRSGASRVLRLLDVAADPAVPG